MRVIFVGRIFVACLVLVLAVGGCSALHKTRFVKRIGGTSSSRSSETATREGSNSPTIDTLKAFPIYKSSVASMQQQNCSFDSVDAGNREQLQQYLQEEIDCLNQAWQGPLRSAGASPSPSRPEVRYTRKNPYDTDCAKATTNSSTNCRQGITFQVSNNAYFYDDQTFASLWTYINVVSSYGHWLLQALGDLDIVDKILDKAGTSTEQGHDLYRRHNLSAWCLSGVYAGAQLRHSQGDQDFFQSIYNNQDNAVVDLADAPDNQDFPSNQNVLRWFRKGADSDGSPSACNTWTAPASEVS